MCTISFLARRSGYGYALAMNRDEKITRVAGLPPACRTLNGGRLLCPSEPDGGTWIAVNDSGVTLALVNWYSVPDRLENAVSRGTLVAGVAGLSCPDAIGAALERMPLCRTRPFRLVAIFPAMRRVVEWRWDLRQLDCLQLGWKAQQWISSGFDEPRAQAIRHAAFRRAHRQRTRGRLDWLRRLHRSHAPHPGPFSTCMHRADAVTVSYTEVRVSRRFARMRYHAGPPCVARARSIACLRLKSR